MAAAASSQLNLLAPQPGLPVTYYPGFLSQAQADRLFVQSLTQCRWQHNEIKMFGNRLPLPRLEAIYGGFDYQYSGVLLKSEPWAAVPFLDELRGQIEAATGFSYQLVIGNQYRSGTD
ncbi:MAG TPA: alpha-ketoglutarate-dependent dioxygenase AlkB, partial [Trichocoleus sp.]